MVGIFSLKGRKERKRAADEAEQRAIERELEEQEAAFTEGLSDSQKEFFAALKAAYEEDLNYEALKNSTLFEDLHENMRVTSTDPLVLLSKVTKNKYEVKRDSITYQDADGQFTYDDAMEMAKLAALDDTMREKGVTLDGSRRERVRLQAAIEEVNKSLPKSERIKIHNPISRMHYHNAFLFTGLDVARRRYNKTHNTDFKKDVEAKKDDGKPDADGDGDTELRNDGPPSETDPDRGTAPPDLSSEGSEPADKNIPIAPRTTGISDPVYQALVTEIKSSDRETVKAKTIKDFLRNAGIAQSNYDDVRDRLERDKVIENVQGKGFVILRGEFGTASGENYNGEGTVAVNGANGAGDDDTADAVDDPKINDVHAEVEEQPEPRRRKRTVGMHAGR